MSDVSKLKINNVTYNIKDSLALRDAPSDGEEYVRKNGAWEISSGGGSGGNAQVMYYYEQPVNTATDAEIFRITNSKINMDTVVLECTFADPSYITSDVTWTSYEGYIAFTGTCTTATTANVTMAYKTENSISDRLMTLLWENPNPTSNFANQTISLDLSQYEVILFIVKQDINNKYGNERAIDQNLGFVGETITLHVINHIVPNGITSQNSWISTRNADIITTGITFGTGYGKKMTDNTIGTASNEYCIPLKIYGISKNSTISPNIPDSGDIPVTLQNCTGDIIVHKIGKICEFFVNINLDTQLAANESVELGYVPEGYRPTKKVTIPCGSRNRWGTITIETWGLIQYFNCNSTLATTSGLYAQATYIIN